MESTKERTLGLAVGLLGCAGLTCLCGILGVALVLASPVPPPGGLPSRTEPGRATEPQVVTLPSYEILKDELQPRGKAQVMTELVVTGNVTRRGLAVLLRQLFDEAKERRAGLDGRDHVTHVAIRAFTPSQRGFTLAHLGWIEGREPELYFDDQVLATIEGRGGDASVAGSPQALLDRGRAKLDAQDYPGAIEDLTEALGLEPFSERSADALVARGNAKLHSGDTAGAIEDYDAALERRPHLEEALTNRDVARDRLTPARKR